MATWSEKFAAIQVLPNINSVNTKYLFVALLLVLASCSKGETAETTEPPVDNPEQPTTPEEPDSASGRGTLIVYFSWSGHTRTVANFIHELMGNRMVEIEVQEPYSDVYSEVTARARREIDNDIRPALVTRVENMADYDTLIVGAPIWSSRLAPPVKRFLASYDLSGKKILPFCTHGVSGTAQSVNNMREVCPNSEFLQPLAVYGSQAESSRSTVEQWLRTEGVLSNNR